CRPPSSRPPPPPSARAERAPPRRALNGPSRRLPLRPETTTTDDEGGGEKDDDADVPRPVPRDAVPADGRARPRLRRLEREPRDRVHPAARRARDRRRVPGDGRPAGRQAGGR